MLVQAPLRLHWRLEGRVMRRAMGAGLNGAHAMLKLVAK